MRFANRLRGPCVICYLQVFQRFRFEPFSEVTFAIFNNGIFFIEAIEGIFMVPLLKIKQSFRSFLSNTLIIVFDFLLLVRAKFLLIDKIDGVIGSDGLMQLLNFLMLRDLLACELVVLGIDFEVNIDIDVAGGVLSPSLFLIHLSIQMVQMITNFILTLKFEQSFKIKSSNR